MLDLLFAKGTNLLPIDGESADRLMVFKHGYIDRGSSTAERTVRRRWGHAIMSGPIPWGVRSHHSMISLAPLHARVPPS
jgi:hypothetical protein